MTKTFKANKNGKIEFTKKELEALLDEVWKDGYKANNTYTWWSPSWGGSGDGYWTWEKNWHPYVWTTTTACTVSGNNVTNSGTTYTLTSSNTDTATCANSATCNSITYGRDCDKSTLTANGYKTADAISVNVGD